MPELVSLQGAYADSSRCCTPVNCSTDSNGERKSGFSADRPLIRASNDGPVLVKGMGEPIVPSFSINFARGQPHYGTVATGITVEEARGDGSVKFSSVDYNQKRLVVIVCPPTRAERDPNGVYMWVTDHLDML